MFCKIRSLGIHGVSGYEVSVECFLSGGLPSFDVVGLPDAAIKEARERVRAAIKSCGYDFPASRITLNLAPASTKKAGTIYDLPILLGILAAAGSLKLKDDSCAFVGELSLEGRLRHVSGTLPMALAAKRLGIKSLYVPEENAAEATLAEGLRVYPVRSVSQLVRHLTGQAEIAAAPPWQPSEPTMDCPDFADVKGQENIKRALEIAAAGGHNILLSGPPGAGKSMLSKRLPSILPDMTRQEALEATEIHSIMGLISGDKPLLLQRPFRAPHHTVSTTGLSGGGSNPRPGEISLAHNGVLFLDELPEFNKDVIEVLRQPLEDGEVTITRVSGTVTFPSRFMLVCAMNPCKCGWYGHRSGRCLCSEQSVEAYVKKLSGPLLDRIDMLVDVPSVDFDELSDRRPGESSSEIKKRVNAARKIQAERFDGSEVKCNAHMTPVMSKRHCSLDEASVKLIKAAFDRLNLTARSYDRILKVARTIADLEAAADISSAHLAEAIQYRTMELGRG